MLAKNLIKEKCRENFHQGYVIIDCETEDEAMKMLKILDSLEFKWKNGMNLLDERILDFARATEYSYKGSMYIAICYDYVCDNKCENHCIAYMMGLINENHYKRVNPLLYKNALRVLKDIKIYMKEVGEYDKTIDIR